MRRAVGCRGWRTAWAAALLLGGALVVVGLRGAADWAGRGVIVAEAAREVPGSPPWTVPLRVEDATRTYLFESRVVIETPTADSDAPLSPQHRLVSPEGRRAEHELEPLSYGVGLSRGRRTVQTTYAWFRPATPGEYQVIMVTLGTASVGLRPIRWSVRLARDVPPTPPGRGIATVGFCLAAIALVMLVLPLPGGASAP